MSMWLAILPMHLVLFQCTEPRTARSDEDASVVDSNSGDVTDVGDGVIEDVEVAQDTGPEPPRPSFCSIEIPVQYLGSPGSCAEAASIDCSFEYDGIPTASTLCDLDEDRCIRPVAACSSGWCYIPPVSYSSGKSRDMELVDAGSTLIDPPQRKKVPQGYFVQATEVTRSDFQRIMGYSHPENLPCVEANGDGVLVLSKRECPAAFGSIYEAMAYANRLGAEWGLPACYELVGCGEKVVALDSASLTIHTCESSRFSGVNCQGLRLPTNAEAELTARAGTVYAFPTGPIARIGGDWFTGCEPPGRPGRSAWLCSNAHALRHGCPTSDGSWPATCLSPQPVRSLLANPFGIFDAQGNVAEFTQKSFCKFEQDTDRCSGPPLLGEADEFFGPTDVPTLTGGSYLNRPPAACSMCRQDLGEFYSNYHLQVMGLRLVRTNLDDCDTLVLP